MVELSYWPNIIVFTKRLFFSLDFFFRTKINQKMLFLSNVIRESKCTITYEPSKKRCFYWQLYTSLKKHTTWVSHQMFTRIFVKFLKIKLCTRYVWIRFSINYVTNNTCLVFTILSWSVISSQRTLFNKLYFKKKKKEKKNVELYWNHITMPMKMFRIMLDYLINPVSLIIRIF